MSDPAPVRSETKVVVASELRVRAATPTGVIARGTRPRSTRRRGGTWLIVGVYVLSATALGLSIYARFFA